MHWQEIVDSPWFRDLPFRIEADATGKIVMSPASNRHSIHPSARVPEFPVSVARKPAH